MKNKYEIRGDVTAIFIKRTNGEILETLIDTADLPKAQEFTGTWRCYRKKIWKEYVTSSKDINGKRVFYTFHRYLIDAREDLEVDHINHDPLDNRRSNLREVTTSENQQNRKGANKNSKSRVRGVFYHSVSDRWNAKIVVNRKPINLGYFVNKQDAIDAVENARRTTMTNSIESLRGA